ncbi:kinase-like domain-containing protein [Mycena albidolilacea]|uniref:Kinase-like domain-containing protein n=1 Tax=Mycena albidolilacea TaxID=1033008 RepID=A0AAD6YYP7_9AGAR|nr:kinase-like domain-containing protein [Mycena albidolilacea]
MHRRLRIITTALDKQSSLRSSPTRSPLSIVLAQRPATWPERRKEMASHKKSIRQVSFESRHTLSSESEHYTHPSPRRRTVKLWGKQLENSGLEDGTGIERQKSFKWIRGQVIGKGTHSHRRVYLGLDATSGEMMAVKQLSFPQNLGELPGRPSARIVERELENMKGLRHPNLIEYLGLEETGDVISIFMEYVGGSIRANVRQYGALDADVVKSFTSQILDGLIYLHAKGLIHGALKSSNVLVEPTGTCKIEGLCCSETEIRDNSRAIPGAIFWTAPEIIKTQYKAYDSKADIWSLGCIVLEMVTGKRPWFNTEAVAVMFKLYQQTLRPHPLDDLELDPVAADLMEKCLTLKPEDRLSAVELKQHHYLGLSPEHSFQGFRPAV